MSRQKSFPSAFPCIFSTKAALSAVQAAWLIVATATLSLHGSL